MAGPTCWGTLLNIWIGGGCGCLYAFFFSVDGFRSLEASWVEGGAGRFSVERGLPAQEMTNHLIELGWLMNAGLIWFWGWSWVTFLFCCVAACNIVSLLIFNFFIFHSAVPLGRDGWGWHSFWWGLRAVWSDMEVWECFPWKLELWLLITFSFHLGVCTVLSEGACTGWQGTVSQWRLWMLRNSCHPGTASWRVCLAIVNDFLSLLYHIFVFFFRLEIRGYNMSHDEAPSHCRTSGDLQFGRNGLHGLRIVSLWFGQDRSQQWLTYFLFRQGWREQTCASK